MTIRDRAKRRPQFEGLEVRETPSGFSNPVTADLVRSIKFTGTGSATVTSVTMPSPRVDQLSGPISGTVSGFGTFSGSGITDLTLASRRFTATAVVYDAAGDAVTLNTHGTFTKSGHATTRFTADHATGHYAGYTAAGTVKTTINATTGVLSFSFSGKARP